MNTSNANDETDEQLFAKARAHMEKYSVAASLDRRLWDATVRLVLSAQGEQPSSEPVAWMCGCGWINGFNLATCARCGRTPNEGSARPYASPQPQGEVSMTMDAYHDDGAKLYLNEHEWRMVVDALRRSEAVGRRMEDDLLAIAETVQPRPEQDSMDYAMIVSSIRHIFEADEEFYINLAAKVRGRSSGE